MGVRRDPFQPMNFGREAVFDLTQFPDFDEIASQFVPAALEPLPSAQCLFSREQLPFFMLFYRQDILEELGMRFPKLGKSAAHHSDL